MSEQMNKATTIRRALGWAILIMMVPLALKLVPPDIMSRELGQRLLNCMLGLIVVAFANRVPKFLTPLAAMTCNPADEQRLRRFTAWTLVLGGLGYSLCWLIVPIASASLASLAVLGAAFLLVVLRLLLNRI